VRIDAVAARNDRNGCTRLGRLLHHLAFLLYRPEFPAAYIGAPPLPYRTLHPTLVHTPQMSTTVSTSVMGTSCINQMLWGRRRRLHGYAGTQLSRVFRQTRSKRWECGTRPTTCVCYDFRPDLRAAPRTASCSHLPRQFSQQALALMRRGEHCLQDLSQAKREARPTRPHAIPSTATLKNDAPSP
jgi:hypothetical protein